MIKKLDDAVIKDMAERYGTPFFLYDGDAMMDNYNRLRASLSSHVDIYYSLKANHNLHIANSFKQAGSGIEVASKGELYLALQAGFDPANIIFSGPGKQEHELQAAIDSAISCIIVESAAELDILIRLGEQNRVKIPVAIRVNPDSTTIETAIQMAGIPRQFGIDEKDLLNLAPSLRNEWIQFRGIHVYTGTQLLKHEEIIQSFAYTMELALRLQKLHDAPLNFINLGGGFGVPYFAHEKPLDMDIVVDELNRLVEHYSHQLPGARFIIESGRMLTAPYGTYVSKVTYVKESKGETFAILDGGLNHHAAATFRGRHMRNNFPSQVLKRSDDSGNRRARVNLVGPLCTPEDCIGKSVEVDFPEPGDLVCVYLSGGYCLSYSPTFFLGHPMPAEIMYRQDELRLIRMRGNESDLLLNQIIQ